VVPKRLGDELRQRRLLVGLKQTDIARSIGTTRAYISAVENGSDWDPDADKLVVWARTLGWEDDAILARLGRVAVPVLDGPRLTSELVRQIKSAVAEGVREGIEVALREAAANGRDS
jgi:transcriptional regulator with XRE-family HTH domain